MFMKLTPGDLAVPHSPKFWAGKNPPVSQFRERFSDAAGKIIRLILAG